VIVETKLSGELAVLEPNEAGFVDSRALHKAMKVKARYNDWIGRRNKPGKYLEGIDFIILKSEYGGIIGQIDYWISPFLAENFAMMEDTPLGDEVRMFYVKCRIAVGLLKKELDEVRHQRDVLLKPKRSRVGNTTYVTVPKLCSDIDMFGLTHTYYLPVKVALDEATDQELMDYRSRHRTKTLKGIIANQETDNDKSVVIPFDRKMLKGGDE
jgi:phage anti-repressor protein